MNAALKYALTRTGLDVVEVAARLDVDPKTVERWLAGRVPHRRNRLRVSELVDVPVDDLWPNATPHPSPRPTGTSEVQAIYPHRWQVPPDVWRNFFARAEREIGVLVYSGLFLFEDAAILRIFADRAAAGVRVRLLLGDPDSPAVAIRGAEEGITDAMSARIRNALVLLRPLLSTPNIELRTHSTTLYNSIYRADDALLINAHIHSQIAAHSPVLSIGHSSTSRLAATYLECFQEVWKNGDLIPPNGRIAASITAEVSGSNLE